MSSACNISLEPHFLSTLEKKEETESSVDVINSEPAPLSISHCVSRETLAAQMQPVHKSRLSFSSSRPLLCKVEKNKMGTKKRSVCTFGANKRGVIKEKVREGERECTKVTAARHIVVFASLFSLLLLPFFFAQTQRKQWAESLSSE